MKVQCEYCQNMVEVQPGVDKVCPFCGSPLPAAPEPPGAQYQPPRQPKPASRAKPVASLVLAVALMSVIVFVLQRNSRPAPENTEGPAMPDIQVSDALDALNEGTEDGNA